MNDQVGSIESMSITNVAEVDRDVNVNTFSTNLTLWDTKIFLE